MRAFYTICLGAFLSVMSPAIARAAGVTPAAATPVQREQAQSRFLKGRDLYTAKKYDAAVVELNASLDIVASPNTRLILARCLRDMGRLVAAYVEFGRTGVEAKELVRDDTRYEKAGIAATDERAQLLPKLGFVEVSITHSAPETVLKVSGETIRRGGWDEPLPVMPGDSIVRIESEGHEPVVQAITVAAGEHKALTLDANADGPADARATSTPEPRVFDRTEGNSTLRSVAFASAGVAVAGLGTFAGLGILANGTYGKLEDACGSERCPPGHESDISRGRTEQTIANVGLVVFGVAAVTSVTLFVISAKSQKTTARVGLGSIQLGGSF